MKKNPIKGKASGELMKMLAEKREALREHRFAAAGARAKNPNEPRMIRADIARILSELKGANA